MSAFVYKEDFLRRLVAAIPEVLRRQDPETGRFGEGIWTVNDQHAMYPLAVAWATESPENPYYHDDALLKAIIAAGDALIKDADEDGRWEFRKKDGSTWGQIYMPWTYTTWICSYTLVRDGMPDDARKRWDDALIFGYTGIAAKELGHIHNIPTYHAAGLYVAGRLFVRADWCDQASDFLLRVVGTQDPGGFWSENYGPVVGYNLVYVEALGIYYAVSGDERVLPALQRSAAFHSNFTYPDGSRVETVDERQPYHAGICMGNLGFTFTPEGRGYQQQQFALKARDGHGPGPEMLADLLHLGEEGPTVPTAAGTSDRTFVVSDGDALVRRKGAWFVCMSAYHCPIPTSRWIQDRQNLVSVYHDRCGLIIGGGNTKLQPLWSTFTVGDTSLLKRTPGDESPDFMPRGTLQHVPSSARLTTDPPTLDLVYGGEDCSITTEPQDDSALLIRLSATCKTGEPVAAHLTFMPHIGEKLTSEKGTPRVLGDEPFALSTEEVGSWISLHGWKLTLPEGAKITWPVLPHNPYTKDGSAKTHEGRLVVTVTLDQDHGERELVLSVGR